MKKLSRLLSSGAIALTTAAAASAASVNVYGLLDYGFSLSRFSGAGEQARHEWQLSENPACATVPGLVYEDQKT